jgi:glyoxylase I family protein
MSISVITTWTARQHGCDLVGVDDPRVTSPEGAERHAGPVTDLAEIHHIALTVADLDASVDWYAQILGFEPVLREESEARRACVMQIPGATYQLGLVQHASSAGDPFDPTRHGLDHLALTVDSHERLDEWAERLSAAGIEHSGPIDIPPGAILNFKDPDGISLALFWDRT